MDDFDALRRKTLRAMYRNAGGANFYRQVAIFDSEQRGKWIKMESVQASFGAAEGGYDTKTRTYSESMRLTLHAALIYLFKHPAELRKVNKGQGIYSWFIRIHRTAFAANGVCNLSAWQKTQVMWNTPGSMLAKVPKVYISGYGGANADWLTIFAADYVRDIRRGKGLPTTSACMSPAGS